MNTQFDKIFKFLNESYSFIPVINKLSGIKNPDPFRILVTTMLSARTKDETTERVSNELFKIISRPEDVLKLKTNKLEQILYKVGFYKTKTKHLIELSKILVSNYKSKVPSEVSELIKLPGVGIKTASLVMAEAFGKNEICVDTHVHRISNRLGIVKTNSPEKTRQALINVLPHKYWRSINNLMVSFGKTICKPVNPHCYNCKLSSICFYYEKNNGSAS